MRRLALLPLFILLLFAVSASATGPEPAASILQGRVLDPTQAAIAGARIVAVPDGGSTGPSTLSDAGGRFTLVLSPARYTLTISAQGFEAVSQPVDLLHSAAGDRDFVLRIGGVVAVVNVTETAGYQAATTTTATKTLMALRDVPQSIHVVTREQMSDQLMMSVGDVVRYVPGITAHQGENNRDQVVIRGNSSSADFFVNGVRDDVQYYRDLYNVEEVEALKGPNAMVFGRGGGGGVINRVTKEAGFAPLREITFFGGSQSNKRVAADFDHPFSDRLAFRGNAMYENSGSFRDDVDRNRFAVNPTLTYMRGADTKLTFSYEHARDNRVADRGIPSFQGRPADTPIATYFGDPDNTYVRSRTNLGSAMVEHRIRKLTLRNRTLFGAYDRGYQNYVPGAVNAAKTLVSISAYSNATQRFNFFNQTDATYALSTGGIRHTLLGGIEYGRQLTDNFRTTGFFNNTTTSTSIAYADPRVTTPVTFRQSATDADNHVSTKVAAAYAQDQVSLSRYVQVIGGVRFDYFDLNYHNNRTSEELRRLDHLVSPRAGIVLKPFTAVSIYGNYSVSYLPSSGDQFSSLTTITRQVKPEKFNNYEFGVKWDVRPDLSLTSAVYRLDRTNTRSTDPNDPTRIVQTGRTRTDGVEIGVDGRVLRSWKVAGGYAYQDARIVSDTSAAKAGAQVAQVPHHTFSLWNHYQFLPKLSAGLGIVHSSDMFAAVDNTVVLPGYTRADAAVYYSLTEKVRLQANIENLSNHRYYLNADGNNNISPGSPRAVRVGMTARF